MSRGYVAIYYKAMIRQGAIPYLVIAPALAFKSATRFTE